MLGSLTAFAILLTGVVIGFFVLIGIMVSIGSESAIQVEDGSVLVFDLNAVIQDAPTTVEIGIALQEALSESNTTVTYTLNVVKTIERASADKNISALLLHGDLLSGGLNSGLVTISEIRQALETFKASGKKVYAYLLVPSQKDYYLASIADEIWIHPFGMISLNGLAINSPFLGGAFEKYGIGVQTTRVGAYKSAVEMFTGTGMSAADREQKTVLLGSLWNSLLTEISASRKISQENIQELSSEKAFFTATDALTAGLADRSGYIDELIDQLTNTFQPAATGKTFRQINLIDYAEARGFELDTCTQDGKRIAIVYAEGEITDGGYQAGYIGCDWLAYELRRLRQDDDVKAVVLRVNSPGGSAVASEIIQRETRLLAEQKPLIVSMGNYAASGGYWISAYANKIYAQPCTITGSIGAFGMVFNIKNAAENVAVHFDGVKTAPFADIYSISRPRTDEEMALIQKFTDEIYEAFINKVAEGRSIELATVSKVAQGRVWSGTEAKDLNLIDETGGLNAAIDEAFQLSGLSSLAIEQVPASSELADKIALLLEKTGAAPVARVSGPLSKIAAEVDALTLQLRGLNDPRGVYTRMPYGLESL